MCSLAGFISREPLHPHLARDLCQALLFYGEPRGNQSTGIYVNGRLLKAVERSTKFVFTPAFFALFDQPAKMALLHTRQPTTGGRTADDAHRLSAEGVGIAREAGLEAEPFVVKATGPVWKTIVEIADRKRAAMIVMGAGSPVCAQCCWAASPAPSSTILTNPLWSSEGIEATVVRTDSPPETGRRPAGDERGFVR